MLQTTLFFQYNNHRVQCICDIFLWQTVSSTKIEIFCLSLQPLLDSFLARFIVRIADTTKVRLQIAEQKIVTGSQVRTVCRLSNFTKPQSRTASCAIMDLWIIYLGLVDEALKDAVKEWLEGRQKISTLCLIKTPPTFLAVT